MKYWSVKIIVILVASSLIWLNSAHPTHAWWFLANHKPQSESVSVEPRTKSGLILSPLWQSILPQFILEPLQQTKVEDPPALDQSTARLIRQPLSSPTPKHNPSKVAQQMLEAVNAVRQLHGLDSLLLNSQLSQSAQGYATLMRNQQHFSHTSPDGTSFRQRNELAGYTNWQKMGENIGRGQATIDEVVEDWMNSPTHRQNILNPDYTELGVGFAPGATNYWVQEFGRQF